MLKRFTCFFSSRNIVVLRSGALGDVLCVEPIIRKLRSMGFNIYLGTHHADAFAFNESVAAIFKPSAVPKYLKKRSITIDLDLAYESNPLTHIVDAYIEKVQSVIPDFSLNDEEKIPVYDVAISYSGDKHKVRTICVNSEGSWPSRTYSLAKWKQFISGLRERGYTIFEIGRDGGHYLGVGENYYGKLTLRQTIELMAEADMYIGMDGGLMHFAQSIGLPMFIVFGCTCPNFRIHDWNITKVLWKNTDVLDCAGCHHRRKAPRTFTDCDRGALHCLDWPVEKLIESFLAGEYGNEPELSADMFKVSV